MHPAKASELGDVIEWQLTQLVLGAVGGAVRVGVIPVCNVPITVVNPVVV